MSGNRYEAYVERLKREGIKLIAVDFDMTLISVHTGGMWMFTPRPLASKVRPGFPEFLTEVLKKGLFVAIVTFSPQIGLIRDILKIILSEVDAEKICIRGNTSDWKPSPTSRKEGKLSHIESAAKHFYKTSKVKIKQHEVLLLDDDDDNLRVATQNMIKVMKIEDNSSLQSFTEQTSNG